MPEPTVLKYCVAIKTLCVALGLSGLLSAQSWADYRPANHGDIVDGILANDGSTGIERPNSDPALIERVMALNEGRNAFEANIQSYRELSTIDLGYTDKAIVQRLLKIPGRTDRLLKPDQGRQVVLVEQILANLVNRQLVDEILASNHGSLGPALRGLKELEARYQINLYGYLKFSQRVTKTLSHDVLRQKYMAHQNIADFDTSIQLAKKILDLEPSDTQIRKDLISLLDKSEASALANNHRMSLALLEPVKDRDQAEFRVVQPELQRKIGDETNLLAIADDKSQLQTAEISAGDFETRLDYLAERIFQDPANLNLNLEYFQQQISEGELEGAEITLERILLIDPDSKFAKILMAETQIKLGKLSEARNILNRLLASDDLVPDMRKQALNYVAQIEEIVSPITWRSSVGLTAGVSHNALGRSDSGLVLFQDLTLDSGQADVDVAFNELNFDSSMAYRLPYESPITLTMRAFGQGRENDHEDLSRTSTIGGSISLREANNNRTLESSLTLAQTRVSSQPYANVASLAASLMTGLTESLVVGGSLAYTESWYQDFENVIANKENSGETLTAGLSLMGQIKQVGWSVTGKWSDSNAENHAASNDLAALAMALNYSFDNCRNTLSADRTWTRAKAANVFVSANPKKTTQTNWSYGGACTLEDFWTGVSVEPSFRFVWRDAASNILNYSKESSEYSLGVKLRFQ